MIIVTLVLLALSAAASMIPSRSPTPRSPTPRSPMRHWIASVAAAVLLASAATTGAITDPARGFGLAATYVVTVLAAVVGGSAIVTAVFRIARREDATGPGASAGPLHGGRTIGVLERTAVAVSILAGWPEGIAVVLAVKGLARYPELRGTDSSDGTPTTQVSEQFIIGTFTSVLWALAVCGVGRGIVS